MKRRLACLLALLLAAPLAAQEPEGEGPALPVERLAPGLRDEVARVRRDATVTASVPPQAVRCRAEVYRALLGQLPLASRWLRALDLGDYDIADDGPDGSFLVDDKLGARARCERALDEVGRLVVVARGRLEVPVLPRITGTGVIQVRYGPAGERPDTLSATAEVDFRVTSELLHLVSRPFRRALEQVLAEKLAALIRSATALAEAVHADPAACYAALRAGGASEADLQAFRRQFLSL